MSVEPPSKDVGAALSEFLATPLDVLMHPGYRSGTSISNPAISITESLEVEILALFKTVASTVPAYGAFLKSHGIDPRTIRSLADLQKLPVTTKDNYIRAYDLPDLCRDGKIEGCDMVAASSGSTGKSTFWLRFITDELKIATRFEQIFHDSFFADSRRTLAVVCFSLGTWVGGMYTASCCRYLASKGYPITVITPGNNKEEILRAIDDLGGFFDQVVLLGYPPFLKDVIDTGISRNIPWQKYGIKLVTAGEVFSEEWRSLVLERVGSQHPYYDCASLYGTADAGVLGNETPLSICIRRFLGNHPHAARELFGESRLPTLLQYQPTQRYFEQENGQLLFSGDNGIPLIRYNILDSGGIITYEYMLDFLHKYNFDPITYLATSQGVSIDSCRGIHRLPFVYVFGRSDFTVSFFGANIYPENIAVGLEQIGIRELVTGKFVLQAWEDGDKNRVLSVVVELAPQVVVNQQDESKVAANIAKSIVTQLKRLNREFSHYVPPEFQSPMVTLKSHGDREYFPVGVKHRYTRNTPPSQDSQANMA